MHVPVVDGPDGSREFLPYEVREEWEQNVHDMDVDPAELRQVFSRNLRLLVQSENSVAEFCRNIAINRTQFNRYLSGEAFPRPDVLYKICRHFDVDARILLQPLETLREADVLPDALAPIGSALLNSGLIEVDAKRLVPGHYVFYRLSSLDPEKLSCRVMNVTQEGEGGMSFKSFLPESVADKLSLPKGAKNRAFTGMFFQHVSAVSMAAVLPKTQTFHAGYFEYAYMGNPDYLYGFSVLSQRLLPEVSVLQPAMLKRLDDGYPALMAARRKQGVTRVADQTGLVYRYFSQGIGAFFPK